MMACSYGLFDSRVTSASDTPSRAREHRGAGIQVSSQFEQESLLLKLRLPAITLNLICLAHVNITYTWD